MRENHSLGTKNGSPAPFPRKPIVWVWVLKNRLVSPVAKEADDGSPLNCRPQNDGELLERVHTIDNKGIFGIMESCR